MAGREGLRVSSVSMSDAGSQQQTPWRRRILGDIHVGTPGGTVKKVPGSGTPNGEKAIARAMANVLDRVRRSIRERSAAPTPHR
jgi:hypothetical protein